MMEKVVIGRAELYCGDCLEILPMLPTVVAVDHKLFEGRLGWSSVLEMVKKAFLRIRRID